MHMKGNICVSSGRERQALKGNIESKNKRLNIYFDSDDSGESDCDNEKKCLSDKSDDLHINLGKLNISSSRKSETDDDDECKLDVVAKGLISEREQRREKRVQSTKPYPNASSHIILSTHQNGADVMVERVPNYIRNEMVPNIPIPVIEHSRVQPLNIPVESSDLDDIDIDSILRSDDIVFKEEDLHKIMNALDNQPGLRDHAESTQAKVADQMYEYAESESGYATSPTYSNLSPHSSVHSPNSLHSLQSPDPRGVPKYDTRLPAEYDTYHSEYSPQDNLYKEEYYKPSISKQINTGRYMQDRVQTVSTIVPRLMSQSQMIPQRPTIMPREVKNYKRITPPIDKTKYLQPATETLVYETDLKKTAKDRYLVKFNMKVVSNLWTIVASTNEKDFCSIQDDKTCLTKLLLMKELPKDFIIRVYTTLQRMTRTNINLLKHRDKNDRNALYMAALIHQKQPIIARFIADSYVHHDAQEYSPDESYANDNTLLHILAGENDECAQVLAELLHTEMLDGTKSFKVNSTNKDARTALHIAAKKHSHSSSTLNISHLLIKHGADLTIRDKDGNTPLHIALKNHCDPIYIKALLQSTTARQCINILDSDSNTALHLAAGRNDISFEKQKEVMMHLVSSNAQHDIHNRDGKVAVLLVSTERKEDLRKIFQRRM